MSQIILHHTIPGSGTNLTRELLKTHPQISYVKLNTEVSITPIIACLMQGVIDRTRFDRLLTWVAHIQKDNSDPRRMGVFAMLRNTATSVLDDPLHNSDLEMAGQYVTVFSHIYFRGMGSGWGEPVDMYHISDLLKTGYSAPCIIPLRDPILSVCTMLAKGHGQDVILHACKFLNEYPDDLPTFFVPVDLYSRPEDEAIRIHKLGKLFEEFLGLKPAAETIEFLRKWPNINKLIREERLSQIPDGTERRTLLSIFEVQDRLYEGLDPRGIMPLVDVQIEEFKKLEGLKALYESYGYRDLCWF